MRRSKNMLEEIKDVRQIPDEGFRRWFTDKDFDLIIWYEDDEISGFQLCYDKTQGEKALTWYKGRGYAHNKIDDGEIPYATKMTPILVPDGAFNKSEVAERFRERAVHIDDELADFVYKRLLEYP
jgi:hypothetical protein